MQAINDTLLIIHLSTALLGLAIAFFLITKKINNTDYNQPVIRQVPKGNKLLLLIVLIISLQSILILIYSRLFSIQSTFLLLFSLLLSLIIWPLFYFYLKLKAGRDGNKPKRYILHLFFLLLIFLSIYLLNPAPPEQFFTSTQMNALKFPNPPESAARRLNRPGRFNQNRRGGYRGENQRIRGAYRNQINSIIFASLSNLEMLLLPHQGIPPVMGKIFAPVLRGSVWPIMKNNQSKDKILLFSGIILSYKWFYLVLMLLTIFSLFKNIQLRFLTKEKFNSLWLIILTIVVGIILIIQTFLFLFGSTLERPIIPLWLNNILPAPLLYILTIGGYLIFSLKQKKENNHKYGKNILKPEELEAYYGKLVEYIKKDKPFLEESITLEKIARELNIRQNNLSQVINLKCECNFADFINSYRVIEVKKELLNPRNKYKKILAIAHDSGFNSKSSFNYIFKKHTKMTPSEFIKSKTNHPDISF